MCALLLSACTHEKILEPENKLVSLSLGAKTETPTKTAYNAGLGKAEWLPYDRLGVSFSYNGELTQDAIGYFESSNTVEALNASFSGNLFDHGPGEYVIFGIYPYHGFHAGNDPTFFLPEIQYPSADNWDSDCDFMLAKSGSFDVSSLSEISATLNFTHIMGWLQIDFTGLSVLYPDSADEEVVDVTLSTAEPLAGNFDVEFEDLTITTRLDSKTQVKLDYQGRGILFGNLKAYVSVFPGNYSEFTVTVRTEHHTLTFVRGASTVKASNISFVTMTHKEEDTEVDSDNGLFPKNDGSSTFNILMFGHSYGQDYTEYLPKLLTNAGINNVSVYRVMSGNCPLQLHWERVKDNLPMLVTYNTPGSSSYVSKNYGVAELISSKKWDVVLLQTSLEYEGHYSFIQPYLDNIINYISDVSMERFGKVPLFGWHFFWPVSEQTASQFMNAAEYGYDAMQMYCCYRDAAKEVLKKTDVSFVVPSGTAVMDMRQSDLNTPEAYSFTRDGYHMDFGAGRYLAACTLFESVIEPVFGISCLGNSFRVPPKDTEPNIKLPVTDDNAAIIQSYAVKAIRNKFEIEFE